MRKFIISIAYLTGVLINAALLLVGVRIIEAGTFSGRAGHIATGSEARFFGLLFIVLGLGGAVTFLIAYTRYLMGKRRLGDANE